MRLQRGFALYTACATAFHVVVACVSSAGCQQSSAVMAMSADRRAARAAANARTKDRSLETLEPARLATQNMTGTPKYRYLKVKMVTRTKISADQPERRVHRDRRDEPLRRPERHHQTEEDEPLRQSFLIGRRQGFHALHVH